jgi:hypothetical protein
LTSAGLAGTELKIDLTGELPMKITQSEYARRRGYSKQYVGQLVSQGIIPRCDDGLIDSNDADEALEQERPHPLRVE